LEAPKKTRKIVTLYILFGILWIALSDSVLFVITSDPLKYPLLQTYKGYFYVLSTGILLYFLISHYYHNVAALHEKASLLEVLMDKMYDESTVAIVLWDMDGRIHKVSRLIAGYQGKPVEDFSGKSLYEIPVMGEEDLEKRIESLKSFGSLSKHETVIRDFKGMEHVLHWNDGILRTSGSDSMVLSFGTDVTKEMKSNEKLRFLAYRDPVTGLYNRDRLVKRIEDLVLAGNPFTLCLMDLKGFKDLNDYYGYSFGDRVLGLIGGILREHFDPECLYRWVGDKFVLVWIRQGEENDKIQRLMDLMKKNMTVGDIAFSSDIHLGLARFPDHGKFPATLLKRCELALAEGKKRGAVQVFEKSFEYRIKRSYTLREALKKALAEDALTLNFQPIYHIGTRRVTALETLLRWQDPVLGRISPEEFIPIAEESSLILQVDEWVVRHTLGLMCRYREAFSNLSVSINLSGKSLVAPGFKTFLKESLGEFPIDPGTLGFEVTEYSLIKDWDQCVETLVLIKDLGFKLILDDFGTLYSSLNYLTKLPLDVLKIDKVYVDRLLDGGKEKQIVSIILKLAQMIQVDTVAEGIETAEQEDALRAMGCHYGQGFYFSKPMGIEEFLLYQEKGVGIYEGLHQGSRNQG